MTNKRKHSNTVKLSYLNYSLRCKTNDLGVLVSKFLPQYLAISWNKNYRRISIFTVFIENHDMRNRKDTMEEDLKSLLKKD